MFRHRKEPAIAFHHIPKCGGTSLNDALYTWFSVLYDYESQFGDGPSYQRLRVDERQLNPTIVLVGHWNQPGSYLHERYPRLLASKGVFLFTFLREPLEAWLSLYRYQEQVLKSEPMPLGSELIKFGAEYFSSQFPCDESNYRSILRRYHFIGFTEKLQEDFEELRRQLIYFLESSGGGPMSERALYFLKNRAAPDLKRNNATSRRDALLTREQLRSFRRLNLLDYKIYEEAKALRTSRG